MEEKKVVTVEQVQNFRLQYLQKFAGFTEEESKILVDILTSPTPPDWIKTRPARGGKPVPYIAAAYFIKRLNDAFGFLWSYECTEHFEKNNHIVAKGRFSFNIPGRTITHINKDGSQDIIRFDGMTIIKEQFGSAEIKVYASTEYVKDKKGNNVMVNGKPIVKHLLGDIIDLGDDYKGASTDAMKKCGTQLGMFLDVYGPRESEEEAGLREQYEVLFMRGQEAGMDEAQTTKWAEEKLGKKLKESDSLSIMQLIPDLLDMAREKS